MRQAILVGVLLVLGVQAVEARERPIEQLPADVRELASAWAEPMKQVARETRRFDPISGLWFGMLEGSVRSIERTADFLFSALSKDNERDHPGLLRYTF